MSLFWKARTTRAWWGSQPIWSSKEAYSLPPEFLEATMTRDEFWSFIEEHRDEAAGGELDTDAMFRSLSERMPEEIEAYQRVLDELRNAAYRWDLWAVAYLMNGGCSDDGFEYFRCWLISKGRGAYESALAAPETAARWLGDDEIPECEELLYVGYRAYRQVTGQDPPPTGVIGSPEPAGEPWDEDNLDELAESYPELWERFGWDGSETD